MSLNPKQQRFVEEYLVDLCGAAAYRRAGYTAKSDAAAEAGASRLLSGAKVREAVALAQAARAGRTGITQDWVLAGIRENFDRAMQKHAVLDSEGMESGQWVYNGAVANKALELAGKHLGMWKDKVEHSGPAGGPIPITCIEVVKTRETTA